MRSFLFVSILVAVTFSIGCGNAAAPVKESNTAVSQNSNDRPQTMIAHSTENQPPVAKPTPGERTKWSQGGNPIDTKDMDSAIISAEKLSKTSPSEANKKLLAAAYFKRAFALTEARQYASALGDYRKTVKLDPTNEDAKQWIDQIQQIYDSMNKEAPKEGEEPPPLPYKPDANTKEKI